VAMARATPVELKLIEIDFRIGIGLPGYAKKTACGGAVGDSPLS